MSAAASRAAATSLASAARLPAGARRLSLTPSPAVRREAIARYCPTVRLVTLLFGVLRCFASLTKYVTKQNIAGPWDGTTLLYFLVVCITLLHDNRATRDFHLQN